MSDAKTVFQAAVEEFRSQVFEGLDEALDELLIPKADMEEFLAGPQWSPEVFDEIWAKLKAKGWGPHYLVYLLSAAVRTGEVTATIHLATNENIIGLIDRLRLQYPAEETAIQNCLSMSVVGEEYSGLLDITASDG